MTITVFQMVKGRISAANRSHEEFFSIFAAMPDIAWELMWLDHRMIWLTTSIPGH